MSDHDSTRNVDSGSTISQSLAPAFDDLNVKTQQSKISHKQLLNDFNSVQVKYEKQRRAMKSIQYQLTVEQNQTAKLKIELIAAIDKLKIQHTTELERQQKFFKKDYDELKKSKSMHAAGVKAVSDLRDLREAHDKLKDEHQTLLQTRRKFTELKDKVAEFRKTTELPQSRIETSLLLQKQNANLRKRVLALEAEVEELCRDRDNKSPLVLAGAAIRLRFLENARENALGIHRCNIKKWNVAWGNEAAHSGNGEADASLFRVGFLRTDDDAAVEVFKTLYYHSPTSYGADGPFMLQATDHFATLVAVKVIKSGGESVDLREKVRNLIGRIFMCHAMSSSQDFDQSYLVEAWLRRVRKLTHEIVALERRRGFQSYWKVIILHAQNARSRALT